MEPASKSYVSRAGLKLEAALRAFGVNVHGRICADLGSNAGGFVDCLSKHGAAKVYAIERGYGVLDYRLRRDARVVVMERTSALSVTLPERVSLVTIDVGWTRQRLVLPAALRMLSAGGEIVSLIKPHYEAEAGQLDGGVLRSEHITGVLERLRHDVSGLGLVVASELESPIEGRGGNREWLWLIRPEARA